ncbi:hypothetical protein [Chitinophaga sp. OAE865]|uniref:hypothetical protein n=1 Tax=Chitinophaga sp. OAE865 TaxID=2817898 RepID=UPI001AEA568B
MLIDVIFRGLLPALDLSFLKKLLTDAREVHFNFPENRLIKTFEEIIGVIRSNSYVDLAISTDCLDMEGKIVPKVFINLGRDNNDIEILFFFDLRDLNEATPGKNIDYLRKWMSEMKRKYHFQYFICQDDNAGEDAYYFDSNGIGRLYNKISD